jgi:hypothetical protein
MRPSGGPLWNLPAEFARLEGRGGDVTRITDIIRQFNRRGATLSQVAGALDGLAGKRLCLLVDQFEEIFRFERETSREETELFIDLLIGEIPAEPETIDELSPDSKPMLEPDGRLGNLHIVITMRSEFLGECARFDRFAEAINRVQYLVPRLTRAGLMRAIRQPAQLYGGEVTAELSERLAGPTYEGVERPIWRQLGLKLRTGIRLAARTMAGAAGSRAKCLSHNPRTSRPVHMFAGDTGR